MYKIILAKNTLHFVRCNFVIILMLLVFLVSKEFVIRRQNKQHPYFSFCNGEDISAKECQQIVKKIFHFSIFEQDDFIQIQEKSDMQEPADYCVDTKLRPSFKICVHDVKNDIFVSDMIIKFGWYEPKVSILIKKLLEMWSNVSEVSPKMLDIGANLGIHALYAAKLGYEVWVVEPQELNLKKMYKSSLESNLTNNMVFIHNGIDEVRRRAMMHIDIKNNGGSFVDLHPHNAPMRTRLVGYKNDTSPIEIVLLSDVLRAMHYKETSSKIIIKMDIEGFECRAILGSKSMFIRENIVAIIMEWVFMGHRRQRRPGPCPKERVDELTRFLVSNHYVPFGWGSMENEITRLNINNKGNDWTVDNIIWLHTSSFTKALSLENNVVNLNLKYR